MRSGPLFKKNLTEKSQLYLLSLYIELRLIFATFPLMFI